MYRGNSSRILPVILVLIVIAITVAALVSVGRALFGGDQTDTSQTDAGREALVKTSAEYRVRMTVRGPIVADENFRTYQITISPNERNIATYSGYLSKTIDSKTYSNNAQAYEQLVHALNKANMMNGTPLEGEKDDTRGTCANGRVYEFEVIKDKTPVERLWTSTCKGSPGSFTASTKQVGTLFREQIPDASDILDRVDLKERATF